MLFNFQRGQLGRRRIASDSGADPYWSSVTLLLGFEDGSGATSFADDSGTFTVTGQGGGAVTTAQAKYGTGSLDVPGTTGAARGEIAQAANAGFDFGGGDFTIELWARYLSGQGQTQWHILDANQTGTPRFLLRYTNTDTLSFGVNGVSTTTQSTYAWTSGNWVHLAYSRSGNDGRLFADGALLTTTDLSGVTINSGTTALYIGNSDTGDVFGGQIDEVRFTKGVGRYTAAFTPPAAAFPRA